MPGMTQALSSVAGLDHGLPEGQFATGTLQLLYTLQLPNLLLLLPPHLQHCSLLNAGGHASIVLVCSLP